MGTRWAEGLPRWVALPEGVVRATERFLLTGFQATGSRELLGSWAVLEWLRAPTGELSLSALASAPGWPERWVADAEMALAGELQFGAPYPEPEWWDKIDPALAGRLDPHWWAAHHRPPGAREYAHGVLAGLIWVTAPELVDEDALMLAPMSYSTGELMPEAMRHRAAERLIATWAEGDQASATR